MSAQVNAQEKSVILARGGTFYSVPENLKADDGHDSVVSGNFEKVVI